MSYDIYEPGVISDCCGATVMYSDICCSCGEHCTPVSDEAEDFED